MAYRHNRPGFVALIVCATLLSLILVTLSPFALREIVSLPGMDWARLSNVGQTYGAISALTAALALAGVAISIGMQAREARYDRWEAGHARHFEIMRIAMEDPLYRQVFAFPKVSGDMAALFGYINLVLRFWATLWEFGGLTEYQLRNDLSSLLTTEAGRTYWRANGKYLLQYSDTKREIEFYQTANKVYEQSTLSDSATAKAHKGFHRARHAAKIGGALTIGAVGGLLAQRTIKQTASRVTG
jgi:Family of unknown function (DUF6082)